MLQYYHGAVYKIYNLQVTYAQHLKPLVIQQPSKTLIACAFVCLAFAWASFFFFVCHLLPSDSNYSNYYPVGYLPHDNFNQYLEWKVSCVVEINNVLFCKTKLAKRMRSARCFVQLRKRPMKSLKHTDQHGF